MSTQTPREIAFEDIRAGDEIRAECAEGGVKFRREGVAGMSTRDGWFTREGRFIAGPEHGPVTLLHRPVPAEPKGLGAVVRARTAQPVNAPHLVRTLVRTAAHILPWVDQRGSRWDWSDLDPDSIEVLSEGIEVEP